MTRADAVKFFMKMKDEPAKAPQTADTSAQAAPSPPSEDSPAAEPAQASSPEASPKPEEASPEAKTEGQADDALSQESQQQPPEEPELDEAAKKKLNQIVGKRVSEYAKKQKQIEGQLAQEIAKRTALENQLKVAAQQQPATPPPAPIAEAPLPDIKDPAALVSYRKQAKSAMETIEGLLDSEAIESGQPVEHNGNTYTKAQLKANKREIQKLLDDTIPAQQEFFQQQAQREQRKAQIFQNAIQEFPILAKPPAEAPEVAQAVQFLRNVHPAILDAPEASWIVGLLVEGSQALAARKNAANAKETAQDAKPEAKAEPKVVQKKAPTDQAAVSAPASPRPSPGNLQRTPQMPKGNIDKDGAAALLAQLAQARGR